MDCVVGCGSRKKRVLIGHELLLVDRLSPHASLVSHPIVLDRIMATVNEQAHAL